MKGLAESLKLEVEAGGWTDHDARSPQLGVDGKVVKQLAYLCA